MQSVTTQPTLPHCLFLANWLPGCPAKKMTSFTHKNASLCDPTRPQGLDPGGPRLVSAGSQAPKKKVSFTKKVKYEFQLEGNELEQFTDTDSKDIPIFRLKILSIKYNLKWSLESVIKYVLKTGTKL